MESIQTLKLHVCPLEGEMKTLTTQFPPLKQLRNLPHFFSRKSPARSYLRNNVLTLHTCVFVEHFRDSFAVTLPRGGVYCTRNIKCAIRLRRHTQVFQRMQLTMTRRNVKGKHALSTTMIVSDSLDFQP